MVLLRQLLGDVLRRLRLRQGRTLREVSASARVSLGYLSEVERGQKEASSELLAAICGALGTPLSQVFREVSETFAPGGLRHEPVLEMPREPGLRVPAEARPSVPSADFVSITTIDRDAEAAMDFADTGPRFDVSDIPPASFYPGSAPPASDPGARVLRQVPPHVGQVAGHDVGQGDLLEDGALVGPQRDPDLLQGLGHARIGDVFRPLAAYAQQLSVDDPDDVGQRDFRCRPGQPEAAVRSALATD